MTARHLEVPVLCLGVLLSACVRVPAATTLTRDSQDPRFDWIREHVVPVQTIDPDDDDFSDLIPLMSPLSDVRVVLLGEASHGDGSAFLAKTRLIKFLHQHMGFDLLVFESGFYDCASAWPPARDVSAATAFEECAWAMWSQRQELVPLTEYLERTRDTSHPLILAGFDPDVGVLSMHERRSQGLRDVVQRFPADAADPGRVDAFFEILDQTDEYRMRTLPMPAPAVLEDFVSTATQLANAIQLSDRLPVQERMFWSLVLENLVSETRARLIAQMYSASPPDPQAAWRANLERDRQMARNLFWLLDARYAGHKAIVWTATIHAARALHEVTLLPPLADEPAPFGFSMQELFRRRRVLGDFLWERLGNRMYTIAFTAFQEVGPGGASEPPRNVAPAGSLEDLIGRTGTDYSFLDLRYQSGTSRLDLVARPFGHASANANWSAVLDGVFFIRTMTPSTRRPPQ